MKVLIQLGCNSGVDVLELAKTLLYDFILLVDANPYCIELAKETFKDIPNVHYEVLAVSGNVRDATFFIPHFESHRTSAHSSLSKIHVLKHGHEEREMKEIQVKTITFNQLMERYQLNSIEKLFIDCEGEDVEIIQAIDFSRYRIRFIKYEHGHAPIESQQRVISYLENNGYRLETTNGDTIATVI